jgi:hypothetical protein
MMKDDATERSECVFAALETDVRLRGRDAAANAGEAEADAVERTIATLATLLSLIAPRSAPAPVRATKKFERTN